MLIVGLVMLVGCDTQVQPSEEPETIKVGYIGPLTGDAAILGIDASKAIELAIEEVNAAGGINGKEVELLIEDDQYETAKTVTAYNKLVNVDGVETLIVSTYGGLFAISDQAEKDNIMVIDSLDCDSQIADTLPDNIFCVAKETNDLADVIADYAVEQGYSKIGILHSTVDKFMPSVADRFKNDVEAEGVEVKVEAYVPGTIDFKTQLLKVKDSDALVFLGYDEIGIAIRQTEELGIDKPMLTIASVATTPSILDASKGAIDGIYFSFYAPVEGNQIAEEFITNFEKKHGRPPYVFVASDHAYDAAKILLEKILPDVDGKTRQERLEQKKNAFYGLRNYPGVSGTLSMQSDGRISGILIRLYRLEDMKPTYVAG